MISGGHRRNGTTGDGRPIPDPVRRTGVCGHEHRSVAARGERPEVVIAGQLLHLQAGVVGVADELVGGDQPERVLPGPADRRRSRRSLLEDRGQRHEPASSGRTRRRRVLGHLEAGLGIRAEPVEREAAVEGGEVRGRRAARRRRRRARPARGARPWPQRGALARRRSPEQDRVEGEDRQLVRPARRRRRWPRLGHVALDELDPVAAAAAGRASARPGRSSPDRCRRRRPVPASARGTAIRR